MEVEPVSGNRSPFHALSPMAGGTRKTGTDEGRGFRRLLSTNLLLLLYFYRLFDNDVSNIV
jgi:hypothetical protein